MPRFHEELITALRADGKVLTAIAESGDLADDTEQALKAAVERLKESFYVEEERLRRLMASQQDIKRRIRSVRNTQKITKAMELVAASRLRRAQARIEALRPYADRMRSLTVEVAAASGTHDQPLLERRGDPRGGGDRSCR